MANVTDGAATLPAGLQRLLQDPRFLFVGVTVSRDIKKIADDFNLDLTRVKY